MLPLRFSTILGCCAVGFVCSLAFPGLLGLALSPIAAILFAILVD